MELRGRHVHAVSWVWCFLFSDKSIVLSSYPPFLGDTLHEVFDSIIEGKLDYESPPWPEISEAGRDCIQKMLVQQPNKRWTAQQLLQHE